MSQFVETIRIENGRVRNIDYHNNRCNQTRFAFFGKVRKINLRNYLYEIPDFPLIKCRVIYDSQVTKVEYQSYNLHPIQTLKLVKDDSISYSYKFTDRSRLQRLFNLREKCDDVLIVKHELITDTSYANVALIKNGKWYTPSKPLLKGTLRTYLIEKNKIFPSEIKTMDLLSYDQLSLFNAMIPFGKIIIPIDNIYE